MFQTDLCDFFILIRSDTPSPPNSSKYLNLQESGRMKITESYILKPRQVTVVYLSTLYLWSVSSSY